MRLVPARIVRFFFFPPTRVDRESGLASQVPPRRQDLWKTSSEEVPTMSAKSLLCPLPASLALLLAGAHFWRAGLSALSLGCALLALLASVGTPAAPGAGAVILFTILSGVGFVNDKALLAYSLILAINRPIEMLVTSLNVVGDATSCICVAKSEGLLDDEKYNA